MLITSMIANFYLLYGYMSFFYDFQAISDRWTFHHIIPEFPSFFRIDWSNRIPFGRPDFFAPSSLRRGRPDSRLHLKGADLNGVLLK